MQRRGSNFDGIYEWFMGNWLCFTLLCQQTLVFPVFTMFTKAYRIFLLLGIVIGCEQAYSLDQIQFPKTQIASLGKLDSVGMLVIPALDEVSGIVLSQKYPGRYWVHNDSGGAPRLFSFEKPSSQQFSWGSPYEQVFLDGIENEDWEDLMMGSDGALYVADTGNNMKDREVLKIYRFPEPKPGVFAKSVKAQKIRFSYEDPTDSSQNAVRDCEAMCEFSGGILLFTKRLSNSNSDVFWIPDVIGCDWEGALKAAKFLFRIQSFRGVTAADSWIDPETGNVSRIAILSYGLIWVFDTKTGDIQQLKTDLVDWKRNKNPGRSM